MRVNGTQAMKAAMEDADEKALYGSWSASNPHRPGMFRWWRRLMRDIDTFLTWGAMRQEWKALKVLGPARFIYSTFFYRMHMRWMHKRNRHALRRIGPMPDGVTFDRCDWCGYTSGDNSASESSTPAQPLPRDSGSGKENTSADGDEYE